MTTSTAHSPPSPGTVFAQQLRLLWVSRTPWFLAGLVLVPTAAVAAMKLHDGDAVGLLAVQLAPVVAFASGAWGLLVWREEGPSRRAYHWSLPVHVPTHDVARVAAGLVWLLVALALFLAVTLPVGLLSVRAEPIMSALPLLLPHYVLSSLTLYLLVSALATAVNRPTEWLIAGFVAILALIVAGEFYDSATASSILNFLGGAPWGLVMALVVGAVGADMFAGGSPHMELPLYYARWLPIALVWLAIAAGAAVAAAHVRRRR